jgi:opacity protein-like surface antigen
MPDNIDTLTYIASVEGIYDIANNMEIYGRYAWKREENKLDSSADEIDLFSARLTYRFNDRLSLFGEAGLIRYMDRDERHLASMMAVDYSLWQNWVVESGYIFKQFEDFDDNNSTRSQGPFLRLVLKY